MPAIAAPLALTIVGGVALVVAFGAMVGVQSRSSAPDAPPTAILDAPAEITAIASSEEITHAKRSDEPAMVTAWPAQPPATGETAPAIPRATGFVPLGTTAPAFPPAPERTAAIPRVLPPGVPVPASDIPVAETDEEIAALEEEQAGEEVNDLGGDVPDDMQDQAAPPVPAGMRQATVTSPVNLRSGPDNGAQVVKVLPGGADIQAEDDCGWCRVSHDGATGYIYKSFVRYR